MSRWPTRPCSIGPGPAAQSYLVIEQHRRRLPADRRRGGPSRLRLPLRARGLRRGLDRAAGHHLHRPECPCHRRHGRQDRIEALRPRGRRLHRSRQPRRRPRRRPCRRDRRCHRLSRDDQGLGGRRRQGHADRAPRPAEVADGFARARSEAAASFGDDRIFIEKLHREPAPHRDPGDGRQARPRDPPRRARMLDPAPQPEGARRGALRLCSIPRRGR